MLRYSRHARERMLERGITENDVKFALSHPIGDPLPGRPGSIYIKGHATGGMIIKVCVRTTDKEYIITVVRED